MIRDHPSIATLFSANLSPHPLAWQLVAGANRWDRCWPVEAGVFVELAAMCLVAPTSLARAAAIALLANGTTIALSLAL